MVGLERIDGVLRFAPSPLEQPDRDGSRVDVEEREAVLLADAGHVLHIEPGGDQRRCAAGAGGPTDPGAQGTRQDGVDRVRQREVLAAVDVDVASGMQVAGQDHAGTFGLPAEGREEPLVLQEPAALPEELGARGRESKGLLAARAHLRNGGIALAGIGDIGIPLAPFAGRPAERMGRHVKDVPDALVGGAGSQPRLCLRRHKASDIPLQAQEAGAVVDQRLGEVAVAERAESLGDSEATVACASAGHQQRPVRIR